MHDVTVQHIISTAAGLMASGIAGWAIKTLHRTTRIVDVLEVRVAEHDDKHDSHESRGIDHERRISRIEGRGTVSSPA